MENHFLRYQKEMTDLKEFVEKYLEENEALIREYRLEILLSAQEEIRFVMDRGAFKRILDNLLTNSIRYREKDQSRIAITIQKKDGRIFWSVADDGPGVAENCLEKIFESFCRLDEARTHCNDGSGLGLAIVRNLVQQMGGRVSAKLWQGVLTIYVDWPLA